MRKIIISILTSFLFPFLTVCQIGILEKDKSITDIKFLKDNDLLILNNDKKVYKLNIDSKTEPYFYDVTANATGIANSNNIIALGNDEGNLSFFESTTLIKNHKGHSNKITLITFSPSDNLIATSGLDSKIKIWSAKSYDLTQEIDVSSDVVTDIKFSLDEEFLVYSTNKGSVIVWSIKDKKTHVTHKTSDNWVRNIAMCPDSVRYAVCGDDKMITILSFDNSRPYQLKKSHKNIITKIQFMDHNYLLSIGHDHNIVMSNINNSTERVALKHFKGYPRYKKRLFKSQGDRYLSSLSISDEKKLVAVSSFGKGIALTNDYHDLIETPHSIIISEVNNIIVDNNSFVSDFTVHNNSCIIKGIITKPEGIKNAWIHFLEDDENKILELRIGNNGEFKCQVAVSDGTNTYSIIVEDWDNNMKTMQYDFRVTKKNE